MLKNKKNNPIAEEWRKVYDKQTEDVKNKLDALNNMKPSDYQLKIIKKTNPEIKDGDIFILSPRENIYFFGRVLKANIEHVNNDIFVQGKHLVFIFKAKTSNPTLDVFNADYSELLIRPSIVDVSYWNKGYFFNIGNIKVTEYEKKLDYGFIKIGIKTDYYCKEDGTVLNCKPEILGVFGVTTITGIASKIEQQIILDSNLLK